MTTITTGPDRLPTFRLGDDGTLDTVCVCERCGHEERYNFDPVEDSPYEDFTAWALDDAEARHECPAAGSK